MSMSTIRQNVMNLYPNSTWCERVSRMSDSQVYAIWKKSQENQKEEKETEDWPFYHQVNIWEWLNSKEVENGRV